MALTPAEKQAKWRKENPEAYKAAKERYRAKNIEKIRERGRYLYDKDKNKEKYEKRRLKQKFYYIKRTYGLTEQQWLALVQAQAERCAVCMEPFSEELVPHVDHCHGTGRVRGLLCISCNSGMGLFRDNPKTLRAAADYVESHQLVTDPEMVKQMGKKTA